MTTLDVPVDARKELEVGGAVLYWQCAKSTNRADLGNALKSLGRGSYLPEPITDVSALRAAIDQFYLPQEKGEKLKVDPIKGGKGFIVVSVPPKKDVSVGDDYGNVLAVLKLDANGRVDIDPWSTQKRDAIEEAMEGAKRWLPASSISKCLTSLVEGCNGLPLRRGGGTYWLNQEWLPLWEQLRAIFKVCSAEADKHEESQPPTEIYTLEVVANEKMVRGVGDALTHEITAALAKIEEEIKSGIELTDEVCQKRIREAAALEGKIKIYEESFKQPLDQLHDLCRNTGRMLAVAMLQEAAVPARREAVTA